MFIKTIVRKMGQSRSRERRKGKNTIEQRNYAESSPNMLIP